MIVFMLYTIHIVRQYFIINGLLYQQGTHESDIDSFLSAAYSYVSTNLSEVSEW